MKALSVQQPWAWAMFEKGKDVENRTWKTNHRGRTFIHAAKKYDKNAPQWLIDAWKADLSDQAKCGGIIGSVEIHDCVDEPTSMWFSGPYGFLLRNPCFMKFLPCKGQLGFFNVDMLFGCTTKPLYQGDKCQTSLKTS